MIGHETKEAGRAPIMGSLQALPRTWNSRTLLELVVFLT